MFHNGQYCGAWAIDVSGTDKMTFHGVVRGNCYLKVSDRTIKLSQGDAFFFPRDSQHIVTNLPDQEVEVNSAASQPMLTLLSEPSTGLVCGNFRHQHPLFERITRQLPEVILVRRNAGSASSRIIDLVLE